MTGLPFQSTLTELELKLKESAFKATENIQQHFINKVGKECFHQTLGVHRLNLKSGKTTLPTELLISEFGIYKDADKFTYMN